MADVLVIILMFIFPLALLVSFLPRMQDIIFNVLKVMFGAVSFPALAGFLTLIVFYTQTLIATFVKKNLQMVPCLVVVILKVRQYCLCC